ncbi:hypothetical protein POM88_010939 [Heracleum sosnowskyi]|uniref:Uncharacterized protein n=1 Tax=Heracleum sosnowskyi TaxID=360622 RepID=A0AAD8IVE0_9APIA|nr:hypothetical protein POM88_010939 [Heracleum sosnowskyi]
MIITREKKVKTRSSFCDIVHENDKSSDQSVVGRRRCLGLSASIFEFLKPRCSARDTKKRLLATPHQKEKIQPILKSVSKLTLQDWIMSSPSLNVQSSGRVHPSYEEDNVIEVSVSNLLPIDSLSLEKLKLKANDDGDDDKQAEEDSSVRRRQTNVQEKKKVRFRLPEVADIFFMDSADGYYYSKK